ncbi:hypothetical protein Tco_0319348, partial [Tanacetum coccineum]
VMDRPNDVLKIAILVGVADIGDKDCHASVAKNVGVEENVDTLVVQNTEAAIDVIRDKFRNAEKFKECLTYYALANGFSLWFYRSSKDKIIARCGQRKEKLKDPSKGKQRSYKKFPSETSGKTENILPMEMLRQNDKGRNFISDEGEYAIEDHYGMVRSYAMALLDSNVGSTVKGLIEAVKEVMPLQTKDQQRFWHVIPSGGNKFEVKRGLDACKVDEKTVEDYVPKCFREDMYIKAYGQYMKPMDGVTFSPDCSHMSRVLGPIPKKMPRWPRKKRIRAPHENKSTYKISRAGRARKKVPIDTTNLVDEDDIPRFLNTEIDEYDRATLSNNVVFDNGRRIELGMNWNKNKCGRIERCLDVGDSEPLHDSFPIRNNLVANAGNVIGPQQSQVVGVDGEGTSNAAQRTNVPRSIGAKTVEEEGRQELAYKIHREDQKMHKLCNKELEHQFINM